MKLPHLKIDRRLIVSIGSLFLMYLKPEISAAAASVAIALSAANSAERIMNKQGQNNE